jgi:hypothetical protein
MAQFIIGSLGLLTAISLGYSLIPDDKDVPRSTPMGFGLQATNFDAPKVPSKPPPPLKNMSFENKHLNKQPDNKL